MVTAGIRELKQNASAVVAQAAAGTVVTITDRGRPVAQLVPVAGSSLGNLAAAGLLRPATRSLADLPEPEPGPPVSATLRELRDDERF
jgi:prevent-host-death family protein